MRASGWRKTRPAGVHRPVCVGPAHAARVRPGVSPLVPFLGGWQVRAVSWGWCPRGPRCTRCGGAAPRLEGSGQGPILLIGSGPRGFGCGF